jgi:cysteine desulfurase/selenocysteine lyase
MRGTIEAGPPLDVERLREEFPILSRPARGGRRLAYLDNAATTQKPRGVIDRERTYYESENANIHRGVHLLSEVATAAYEGARDRIRSFLGARHREEIVLVRGTTEAINLVAASWGRRNVREGDEILLTEMEHHSNIVPWQLLAEEVGAKIVVAPIDDDGALRMDEFGRLLSPRTRIVSVTQVSNALGTINPVARIVELAHAAGAKVLVDGAQAAPHVPIDVASLGCDFYALSAHKMYGPTGVGVLWGRKELLEAMPPWQGGGDMIASVTFRKSSWNVLPYKFEAGTPNIAGVVAFGAAIEFLERVGVARAAAWEGELLEYGTKRLGEIPGLRLVGTAPNKAAVLSFVLDGIHPHDIGTFLDQEGVAIRTGHHCAQPVMDRFGIPATARASLALYNTRDEIDLLAEAIRKTMEFFR